MMKKIHLQYKMVFTKGHKINIGKPSGMLGKHHTINTKNKISNKMKGKPSKLKGMRISNEHKKRISESIKGINKGRVHTEQSKKNMSLAHIGIKFPHTREWDEHISIGNKGKPKSEEHKVKLKLSRAKQIIPKNDTSIEVKIQNFLQQLEIEFFSHYYINIKHCYRCDIFIPSINLIIECDGNYWHNYPYGKEYDLLRNVELREKGYKILRLWENEIQNLEVGEFKFLLKKFNTTGGDEDASAPI